MLRIITSLLVYRVFILHRWQQIISGWTMIGVTSSLCIKIHCFFSEEHRTWHVFQAFCHSHGAYQLIATATPWHNRKWQLTEKYFFNSILLSNPFEQSTIQQLSTFYSSVPRKKTCTQYIGDLATLHQIIITLPGLMRSLYFALTRTMTSQTLSTFSLAFIAILCTGIVNCKSILTPHGLLWP